MLFQDINFQRDFVLNCIPKLQSFQDNDLVSPSYGSFCYNYWRDKVSDFSDARFQEAGSTMGMLMSDEFDHFRKNSRFLRKSILYKSFSSGISFLQKIQNKNGSFDEWYKGENGFAATVFNIIAYSLVGIFVKEKLNENDLSILNNVIFKASNWLCSKNDLIKTNHQVAAAAALILSFKLNNNEKFKINSEKKINLALKQQNLEGWFPEVGGMDIGYCSVLLDYGMIYHHFSKNDKILRPMIQLFDFMKYLIQPDLTVSKEMGLCLNPYLSRTGIMLLSQFNEEANNFFFKIQDNSPKFEGVSPILGDDLRLSRWSYLPILNFILMKKIHIKKKKMRINIKKGWTNFNISKTSRFHSKNLNIFLSAAGGGVIKVFFKNKLILEDFGYYFTIKDKFIAHNGYDRSRELKKVKNTVIFSTFFDQVKYYKFSFFSKIILRLLCIFPSISMFTRFLVDKMRIKKQTALNQSNAPIANKSKENFIQRKVVLKNDNFIIQDFLKISKAINFSDLKYFFSSSFRVNNLIGFKKTARIEKEILLIKEFNIKKRILTLDANKDI